MLVDVSDRQVLLMSNFTQIQTLFSTRIAVVDLPQSGTNNFIRLMLLVYTSGVIRQFTVELSNTNINYIRSFLQIN